MDTVIVSEPDEYVASKRCNLSLKVTTNLDQNT